MPGLLSSVMPQGYTQASWVGSQKDSTIESSERSTLEGLSGALRRGSCQGGWENTPVTFTHLPLKGNKPGSQGEARWHLSRSTVSLFCHCSSGLSESELVYARDTEQPAE